MGVINPPSFCDKLAAHLACLKAQHAFVKRLKELQTCSSRLKTAAEMAKNRYSNLLKS